MSANRARTLLSELWAISTLVDLSQTAWSLTLKAHATDITAIKKRLESELNELRRAAKVNLLSWNPFPLADFLRFREGQIWTATDTEKVLQRAKEVDDLFECFLASAGFIPEAGESL
jgi:hypothetical protein